MLQLALLSPDLNSREDRYRSSRRRINDRSPTQMCLPGPFSPVSLVYGVPALVARSSFRRSQFQLNLPPPVPK